MAKFSSSNREKALMKQIFQGPSNSDILAQVPASGSSRSHVFEMPLNGLISQNLTLLAKDYRQVHKNFQNPDPSVDDSELCGVYIVARPNRWQRPMTLPFKPCHWSLYSQGHYYHLAEGERAGKPTIILRDDNYSDPQALERNPPQDPFIAYHIGMTDYRSDPIHTLAKWVVTNLAKNDFSVTNYQHFVSALGARILCGPRNGTVLMGDLLQIAEQEYYLDTLWPGVPIPSGYSTGVRLSGPEEQIDTAQKRLKLSVAVETDARGLSLCWKDGKWGGIDWQSREYHPVLRPLAVANQMTILGALGKMKWVFPAISRGFPPPHHEDMALASIYCHRRNSLLPDNLELVPFFGDLRYLRATKKMTRKDFRDQVNEFLTSATSHMAYNRGFENEFLSQREMAVDKDSTALGMLQPSDGLVLDEKEPAEDQDYQIFDTLYTNRINHWGAMCQVFIDVGHVDRPPVCGLSLK